MQVEEIIKYIKWDVETVLQWSGSDKLFHI